MQDRTSHRHSAKQNSSKQELEERKKIKKNKKKLKRKLRKERLETSLCIFTCAVLCPVERLPLYNLIMTLRMATSCHLCITNKLLLLYPSNTFSLGSLNHRIKGLI